MGFESRVKTLLYGIEFSHGIRRALMGALGLIYFLSFGFSVISVTTLFAFSTILMVFFEFPTGAIADYDSRKRSVLISFILMSVAFFGLFVFKDFWLLAGSWVLGDIAWTFYSGAGMAWAMEALNCAKKKSRIVSLISRSYFFEKGGRVLGGIIGLVVIAINFSFVWLFVSVWYLFMFFIVLKYMKERNFVPEKASRGYIMKSIIKAKESFSFLINKKSKRLRVLFLGNFVGVLAISAFFVCVPLLFTQILNIPTNKFSGIVAIVDAFAIIGPIVAHKVIKFSGIKRSFINSIFLIFVSAIILALSRSIVLSIIVFILLKLLLSIFDVIEDSAFHHEFDPKIRASLGSFSNVVWSIGTSISIFLAGISINSLGVVQTMTISSVLILVEALVYIIWLKK